MTMRATLLVMTALAAVTVAGCKPKTTTTDAATTTTTTTAPADTATLPAAPPADTTAAAPATPPADGTATSDTGAMNNPETTQAPNANAKPQ